uniref:Nucleolar protein 12 n=2 Tax=Sus scrofa TaxID=9823 RepID=A0A8D1SE49_PIG
MGRNKKKKRDGDSRRPRLILSFDEEKRREYLTGFHKRKVERKKAAIEEIKQRLKEEQKKLREERHQEYLKMLAEREEALEEADELDRLVTAKTESVQYDHPNHTVTVTTISDLDLSGARLLGLTPPEGGLLGGCVGVAQRWSTSQGFQSPGAQRSPLPLSGCELLPCPCPFTTKSGVPDIAAACGIAVSMKAGSPPDAPESGCLWSLLLHSTSLP